MPIYPNLFIPFPWDSITLYFPLKPLVYFGHCGKAQRSSSCILGALTLTRPIRPTSVTCQGLTPSLGFHAARDRFDRLLDSGVPAYGHGQVMVYPDLPFLRWSYEYDYSDEFREGYRSTGIIENTERYRRAFSKVKEYLLDYLDRHPEHRDNDLSFKDFRILFDTLTSQDTDKGRIKRWIETMVKAGLFEESDSALSYDKDLWLKEAFNNYEKEEFNKRKVVGAILADNFSTSNWYKYYLAVMWYKERFFAICKEQGLAIPR